MTVEEFLAEWHNDSPTVLVHTSGSTGEPKPMLVEKRRMEASARITCRHLGLKPGDTALLCMSLDYIAGKMMVVRALTCGLRLMVVEPSGEPLKTVTEPVDFAAMVPMQVYNSLKDPVQRERLMAVKHLIIGGGAIDDALASELATFPNAIWSTYGMTETLSHIALRRLNGPEASEWYQPFPSVKVSLNQDDCLMINAPLVHEGILETNDRAEIVPGKGFRILGRKDNVIVSGGIKIQIEEVEHALKPHLSAPFIIARRKDVKFGEAEILLTEASDTEAVAAICRRVLPKYWIPREVRHIDHIPMTETGKPKRGGETK